MSAPRKPASQARKTDSSCTNYWWVSQKFGHNDWTLAATTAITSIAFSIRDGLRPISKTQCWSLVLRSGESARFLNASPFHQLKHGIDLERIWKFRYSVVQWASWEATEVVTRKVCRLSSGSDHISIRSIHSAGTLKCSHSMSSICSMITQLHESGCFQPHHKVDRNSFDSKLKQLIPWLSWTPFGGRTITKTQRSKPIFSRNFAKFMSSSCFIKSRNLAKQKSPDRTMWHDGSVLTASYCHVPILFFQVQGAQESPLHQYCLVHSGPFSCQ